MWRRVALLLCVAASACGGFKNGSNGSGSGSDGGNGNDGGSGADGSSGGPTGDGGLTDGGPSSEACTGASCTSNGDGGSQGDACSGGNCGGGCQGASCVTTIVLFGGDDSALPTADTWTYAQSAWTNVPALATAPPHREESAMVVFQGKVLLFGGSPSGQGDVVNDTWLWDGTQWAEAAPRALADRPVLARDDHARQRGRPLRRHRRHQPPRGDVDVERLRLDAAGHRAAPRARGRDDGHARQRRGPLRRPGRQRREHRAERHLDVEREHVDAGVACAAPPRGPRLGVAATVAGKVVLFGGQDVNAASLNDTWTWDGTSWTQVINLTPVPPIRLAAAGAVLNGQFVVFGGTTNNSNDFNDTWIWNGSSWIQGPTSGPSVRAWAAMAGPG